MNPETQIQALLRENAFDLVRQRKHKIYRNPEGLTFVISSTPSDRRGAHNALASLKKMLRSEPSEPEREGKAVTESFRLPRPQPQNQPPRPVDTAAAEEPLTTRISEEEWESWKAEYWREEKLRAKNEKFLSVAGTYINRVSELMHKREDIASGPASDAVKSIMRDLGYKSKVLLYNLKGFEKGIIVSEKTDQPVLWASNGHIGISSFLFFNIYLQHGPTRQERLRFNWEGIPVLFELPLTGTRKFHVPL